jgi:MoaA/NifB/PqqE/SkfB family radical SAM enzyme
MSQKLFRITLDTNPEDCNLHCIMCEEHSEFSDFKQKLYNNTGSRFRRMPLEWIEPLVREAKTLGVREIIPSTMGDPLMSRHFEIMAKEAAVQKLKLNITHNGTFPGKTLEEHAQLIIPICSDIKFSVNGARKSTAEAIMKGIDFDRQIRNIQEFSKLRNRYFEQTGYYCQISFQLTFMQNNMSEIAEIIELAAKLGVDRIKGHHLWIHFPEIEHLSFEKSDKSRETWNEIVKKANKAAEKYRKPNGSPVRLENFHPFNEKTKQTHHIPDDYDCPFLGKELWIAADGKISPCCAPDKNRDTLGQFGYYPKTHLSDVLENPDYKNLQKHYKSHSLCRECSMRRP